MANVESPLHKGGSCFMYDWVRTTFVQFFILSIQIFGSLRLLRRPTPWLKIAIFGVLQVSSLALFTIILPIAELQFIFLSFTYIAYFMWVFEADLFPDAFFCYITPIALTALGELIFPPFFTRLYLLPEKMMNFNLLGPSFSQTAYLPSIILAAYYLIKDACGETVGKTRIRTFHYAGWICAFALVPTICYLKTPTIESLFPVQASFLDVFFRAYIITLPVLGYTLYNYKNKDRRTEKLLQLHQRRRVVQDAALRTLREERHDLLNELTLISTYVQMGKSEEALTSIAYSAAKLSDRYNYATLPADAWTTVIELKQAEAERRGIDFSVDLQIIPPQSFTEQRLLPKVIMNLVDNAFSAVNKQKNPRVTLTWLQNSQGERLLTVTNNGPAINPWDGQMIFSGGVTSKSDPLGNHGWGLAICTQIACELGASLDYESSPEQTSFIFTLPASLLEKAASS